MNAEPVTIDFSLYPPVGTEDWRYAFATAKVRVLETQMLDRATLADMAGADSFTTAADMLVDLDLELNAAGIHLAFAELEDTVEEKIVRYGLLDTIDEQHFYPTVDVAVASFSDERASAQQQAHRDELGTNA